jgi:molybdopterin synthase sulfur carrier subunit
MPITVRYFASVREAVGCSAETVTSAALTAGQLRHELAARGEPWASALARGKAVRVAVNQVMADESTPLMASAEVAFFPPVTGG